MLWSTSHRASGRNDDVLWPFGTPKVPDLEAETTSDRTAKGDNEFWSGVDTQGNTLKLKFVNKTGKRWIQCDLKGEYWLQPTRMRRWRGS